MALEEVFRDIMRDELGRAVESLRRELRLVAGGSAPSPKPNASLLSAKEVAARLGVEPATVRAYIEGGQLAGTKPRGRWMVRPEDLEAFLSVKEERPASNDEQLARILRKVHG